MPNNEREIARLSGLIMDASELGNYADALTWSNAESIARVIIAAGYHK